MFGKRILKPIIVLILAILILFELSTLQNKESFGISGKTPPEIRKMINLSIKKDGIEKTYSKLKDLRESHTLSHQAFHIFGELLYEKERIPGFVYCDSSFGFGCYHGFFIMAISREGIDVLSQADLECVKKFGVGGLGCSHGIGHGIMEYFGHKNISKALDLCSNLSWKGKLLGCQDGVFMEYNFPALISADGEITTNTRSSSDIYSPCEDVLPKYQISCFYNLPSWWSSSSPSSQKSPGLRCQEIDDPENQKACFLGVGHNLATRTSFNIEESIKGCSLMPDQESMALCRAGAAWTFFAQPEKRSVYLKLCQDGENVIKACQDSWNLFEIYKN